MQVSEVRMEKGGKELGKVKYCLSVAKAEARTIFLFVLVPCWGLR
jgi:hypothetical protein